MWQGRFKSPVIQDDAHLLVVLRYIEANPLRARMVADLKDYPWSSFPAHAYGQSQPLLSVLPEIEALGPTPARRQRKWRARVEAVQPEEDLTRVRDSLRTGKPLGQSSWVEQVAARVGFALNPRPRGRPRKTEK